MSGHDRALARDSPTARERRARARIRSTVRPSDEQTWAGAANDETGAQPMQSGSSMGFGLPCLTIVYHDDLRRIGERATLTRLLSREPIPLSRLEPRFGGRSHPRRPLLDPYLSRKPLLLRTLPSGRISIDASGTTTRVWLDGQALEGTAEVPMESLERGAVLRLAESVVLLLHLRDPSPAAGWPSFGLVGQSQAMARVRHDIVRVASLDVSVLLRGETGTGKERVARAIHAHSGRRHGPMVVVDMAALPPTLAATELFGSVRGAFTGATDRQGSFLRAHGGTLFLDELGETPDAVQPLLLRVIETGELRPVGDDDRRRVDARLVAATDADLETAIARGRFRAPLLHRVAGYEIRLPALQERLDDLGLLLLRFLAQEASSREATDRDGDGANGDGSASSRLVGNRLASEEAEPAPPARPPWLRASLVERMLAHDWPGNVRQLRNLVRQLVIVGRSGEPREVMARARELLGRAGPATRRRAHAREGDEARNPPPAPSTVGAPGKAGPSGAAGRPGATGKRYRGGAEVDEEELIETLRAHGWLFQPTAEALGVSRATLYRLVERSPRVRKPSELTREELARTRARHEDDHRAMAEELEVSIYGLKQRLRQLHML